MSCWQLGLGIRNRVRRLIVPYHNYLGLLLSAIGDCTFLLVLEKSVYPLSCFFLEDAINGRLLHFAISLGA